MPDALAELASEARVSIGTAGALPGSRVRRFHGRMTVSEALKRILAGSGYGARKVGPTAWRIEPRRAAPPVDPAAETARTRAASTPADMPQAILVTATKREVLLSALANAVTSVPLPGDARVASQQGTGWIAANVEGMAMTDQGTGRNKIFLRGVADSPFNGEAQSTVAVMLDDARVTYSAPDPDIRLIDIERVDVLKGPQGSLYGTGALGGVYQIRTRRPELDRASLSVSAQSDFQSGPVLGASGAVVANLPIVRGVSALRLVGYSAHSGGWVDTGPRHNANAGNVLGGRASLAVATASGWQIDLSGLAQRLEIGDTQYVYAPGARSRPPQLAEPHDNDLDLGSLRVARRVGTGEFTASSSISRHEVVQNFDATIGAESFGLPDPQILTDDRRYRLWDSEARLSGNPEWGSWLVGISHIEARQQARSTLYAAGDMPALVLDDDLRITSDSALFGNASIELGRQFMVELGARAYRSNVQDTRMVSGQATNREQQRTGLTPSGAIAWKPDDGRIFYLRYGTAFRPGGVDIGSNGQTETYKGDDLATLEAGWRSLFAGGGWFEIGTYFTSWDDVQSDFLLPSGLFETRNAGKARILGLEASLTRHLAADWTLSLGAAVQDARLIRNDLDIMLDDRRLPVVPDYVLRGSIERSFELGPAQASITARLRYIGPSRLSFDPAFDRPMGKVLESGLEGHLALSRFQVDLTLDNLFGAAANQFAFGNPLRLATMPQFTPQRPFSASIGFSASF